MKETLKYISIGLLAIGIVFAFMTLKVTVKKPVSAESEEYLPMGISKFKDGDVTCYLYQNYNKGGISCLK